ncbi:MAG TPA: hypothetical protein DCZ95_00645 [Verrucomicrobia bacterium]|nr:hypothetical protein [Verrucomicrobiota bacterium]
MIRYAFVVFCSLLVLSVKADYTTSFATSDSTNDFRFAQIGTLGSSNQTSCYWNNEALRMEGRYNCQAGRFLRVSDDGSGLNNGYYAGSISTAIKFNYYNGNSTNVRVALCLSAHTNDGLNNYPVYYVMMETNTISLIRKWQYSSTTQQTTLYSCAISPVGGLDTYTLRLNAVETGTNAYGSIINLSMSFMQGSVELASGGVSDAPTAASGAGATYNAGYVGFLGGAGPANNSTYRGIDVTEFSVSVIPEPATFLMVLSGVLLIAQRRKKQDAHL